VRVRKMPIGLLLMAPGILMAAVSYTPESGTLPKVLNGWLLVFSEDFSRGAERWQPGDPQAWRILEDQGKPVYALVQQSQYEPPVRSPFNIALVKDLVVKDCVIEARMKSTTKAYGHRDMCVIFGYQDPSHFYYVHLAPAPDTDPHANSIFLVNGAPRVSIATRRNNGTAWKEDTYHTVRVIRDTETGAIQVFHDGGREPILTAVDKTFSAGRVGVGSFDDTGNIAEFHVWGTTK